VRITVLCTNREHPVVPWLQRWQSKQQSAGHDVSLCHDKSEVGAGDVLFLVSCAQFIREPQRRHFRAVLVLHASDLPRRRGMSPHIWQIIDGENAITVSLMEAREPLDSGDIWLQTRFDLAGTELLPEINERLFVAELELMDRAVAEFDSITPRPQAPADAEAPVLRARTPADSRLDVHKTLAEQFDLLRTVDNDRYPAFFEHRGRRYTLKIDTADE
jgi:methionyl-tRNA formyltransferase